MKASHLSHGYRNVRPIPPELEDQVVRLLLLGNSQESALFPAPPADDEDYYRQVLETILAFANSFGGWLIVGVAPSWLGRVEAPEHEHALTLVELLKSLPVWLGKDQTDRLAASLTPMDAASFLGEPGGRGLSRLISLPDFDYRVYSHFRNRNQGESVQRLFETDFLSSFAVPLPGGGQLLAMWVRALPRAELCHERINKKQALVRVGDKNEGRGNLIGVNWSIYQSLRTASGAGDAVGAQLGNRDLFRAALESLYSSEMGGRHVNTRFWRDHVVHQMYVLLLGIHLWASSTVLQERLTKVDQAPLIWAMTATCHDLGYPFELFVVSLMSQLNEIAKTNACTNPILPQLKQLGFQGDVSLWREISRRLWPNDTADPPLLEQIYDRKAANPQAHLLDHGIVSALIWLALVQRIMPDWRSDVRLDWVLDVAAAIAAHNIRPRDFAAPPPRFDLERHPFACLLALCDSLQEWDRAAIARHVLIPAAVQVNVTTARDGSHSVIEGRFGVDSKVAAEIGELFLKPSTSTSALFDLGSRITLTTESFFAGISASHDEALRLKTLDPWMKEKGSSQDADFIVPVNFAKLGLVLPAPEPGVVYLDTGNRLEPVFDNPKFVLDHVQHLPPGEARLILHEQPDMDAIAAAFFCQELLVKGKLPAFWQPLAKYVDLADRDRLPIDWNYVSTPVGVFKAFIHGAGRDSDRVRRGFMVLRYLTRWLRDEVRDPDADPLVCFKDAFLGRHPFERVQAEAGRDYDSFCTLLDRDDGAVVELEIELPEFPFPPASAPFKLFKAKMLIGRQALPVHYFPIWATLRGYHGTMTYAAKPRPRAIIGTKEKDGRAQRPTLWGLGHLLDQEETAARARSGKPPRSTDPAKRRQPGYPNDDPWYDCREGEIKGGIIDAPRDGTCLSPSEIEACLKNTKAWIPLGEQHRDDGPHIPVGERA